MDIATLCGQLEQKLSLIDDRAKRLPAAVVFLCHVFSVRKDEIAIFRCQEQLGEEVLRFLWPPHLAEAASGYVSLKSDTSLAVRTFLDDHPFMNLLFSSTPHASYFEMLPINKSSARRPPPIQQIMSAPIRREGGFQGVIQVSHKGDSPQEVRPSFQEDDLGRLAQLALVLAEML